MADRIEVTLYTRADCPLCDKAKASMRAAASLHRLPIVIREVDIDREPALRERFTNDVPVIYVGGVEAFRHGVTQEKFVAFIRGDSQRMTAAAIEAEMRTLAPGWRAVGGHHLEKQFGFPDFAKALAFTNRVGALAEEAGHHPDVCVGWGSVRITMWSHDVNGLTGRDFALARKIDALASP